MSASDRLFLRLDGGVAGPYAPQQVRELAEGSLVTRATSAAPAPEGPWQPLGELPQAAEIFPPKAALGFRSKAFEKLNTGAAVPTVAAPATDKTVSALNLKTPVRASAAGSAPVAADAPPNDVRAMVNEVAALEAIIAPEPPPPKPWRPSGRLCLVAALALVGNAVMLAIPVFYDASDWVSAGFLRVWLLVYNGALVSVYFRLPKG